MKSAVEQACHKLGFIDGDPPKQDPFLIDISEDEEDEPVGDNATRDADDILPDPTNSRMDHSKEGDGGTTPTAGKTFLSTQSNVILMMREP